MTNDLETFTSNLKYKIAPAYLREGDRTCYGDLTWVVKTVSRGPDQGPLYTIAHWVAGTLFDIPQSQLEFLPPKTKAPIWTLDVYQDGRPIFHNEDVVAQPDEPLCVSIQTIRWPSLAFLNWIEDFVFDPMRDNPASLFLTLRTHKGHYIDGWHFQDAIPIKQRKSGNSWDIVFDYWKKNKIKPTFHIPKVFWFQYDGSDGEWIGVARAADIEVYREGSYSDLVKIGQTYQSDYRILCIDYLK
jgi:hypothetical protein